MTSTEIEVRTDHQPTLLEQKVMYSRWLAKSNLLPIDYRGKPENVLLAVEYGDALGIKPMTAINMINIIQGRPAISSQLMAALVRQAGHRLRIEVDPVNLIANAMLWRADDPKFAFTSTWDMARAAQAGLAGKDNWKHYAANMLKARATSEVCRDACPEVLAGIDYTPDELGERFLTDPERVADGLMTRGELAEASALERTEHDSSKTVRVKTEDVAADGDVSVELWESDGD
jgi:hypothetical protein